ncbi:MAG: penicillin-binding protein 2 [Balneolaceae bacterium]
MHLSASRRTKVSVRILQSIVLIAWLIILGRIFQLQILDYEKYSPISKQNHLRQEFVNPARGLILDRNGEILVENEPIYSITINPASFDMSRLPLLSELLEMEQSDLLLRIEEAQSYSWHRTSRLVTEVSFQAFSNIQENIWQLPGIGHQIESKRYYPLPIHASHTFGYLREASRDEYLGTSRIRLGDKIGKSGLEMSYEDLLRGELGTEYIRVNALGQALGTYTEGEMSSRPVQGNNIITTLDAGLQQLAEELMSGKRGGVVAIDPGSGEILAIASSPQFNVERLAGRLDTEYWADINSDPEQPLFHRAISSRQPPGSTFKPFAGLVGLHLGIVTPSRTIHNPGYYFRGRRYGDLADPGDYDMRRALMYSSNTYFFALMDMVASRGYLNRWSDLIKDFGFGARTGIDLPSENSGIIPDSTWMNQNIGVRAWGTGDLINFGVGQGFISATPLQLAVAVSVIANGGFRVQPHLVRTVRSPDGDQVHTEKNLQRIEWIQESHLEVVRDGMKAAMTHGAVLYYASLDDIEVAGKTGTAQNPHGNNHGWFITYAPAEEPEIAIAVLVENGGFGSSSAAPIASLLTEKYLTGEINRSHILNHVLNFEPTVEEPEEGLEITE